MLIMQVIYIFAKYFQYIPKPVGDLCVSGLVNSNTVSSYYGPVTIFYKII